MDDIDQGLEDGTVDGENSTDEAVEQPQGHPAYQEILSVIPESLHEVVLPTLKKWDQGVQDKLQSVHSEFEPYRQYIDEYDADTIGAGLTFLEKLNEDPQAVFNLMVETYGFGSPEANATAQLIEQGAGDDEDYDLEQELDPRVQQRLDEQQRLLDELAAEREAQSQAEQEAQEAELFDNHMAQLHEQYGDFDDDYVIALMANGVDSTEAVERFQANYAPARQQRTPAPVVMGSAGNGMLDQGIDPRSLTGKDTKDLVAQMLAAANDD